MSCASAPRPVEAGPVHPTGGIGETRHGRPALQRTDESLGGGITAEVGITEGERQGPDHLGVVLLEER